MKNLILTIALGSVLLTACSKDESFEQIESPKNGPVYILDQNATQSAFSALALENLPSGVNYTTTTTGAENFAHSSGLFQPMYRDPVTLSWFGNLDNTGSYGTVELQINKPTYSMHLVMEAECIVREDNMVTYGAVITEVIELTGNTPPLTAMWRFYFQVTDNDQVQENGTDIISNKWIFASPRSASLCSVYPPSHHIWGSIGTTEVLAPGFVNVTNIPE